MLLLACILSPKSLNTIGQVVSTCQTSKVLKSVIFISQIIFQISTHSNDRQYLL